MAFSKNIINSTFVAVVLLVLCISSVFSAAVLVDADNDVPSQTREGRFYGGGLASSQASAMASSGGYGLGGFPFGGGLASSSAIASAQSGAVGFGK